MKQQKEKFTREFITQVSKEMMLGIDFLHSNNIIHRDIQPGLTFF